jgi:arginine deiminase
MTPATAADALYDDILNLKHASREHAQLTGVLRTVATVLEFRSLLADVFAAEAVRREVADALCALYHCPELVGDLVSLDAATLAARLVEGTPMRKDTLAKFLSPNRFSLPPLPNAFFTRDATMCVHDRVVIGSMAKRARLAESLLFRAVFRHHPDLAGGGFAVDGTAEAASSATIEGGDLLVLREDLVAIGYSERTSAAGIDALIGRLAERGRLREAVVLEMPKSRATIHLDMLFTMVDRNLAVVFPPVVTGLARGRAIRLKCRDGRVSEIREYPGLLDALAAAGLDLEPVRCGGGDLLRQEREQWTSGANFLTLAPGQIIGYGHNSGTLDELAARGFAIATAEEVISGAVRLEDGGRVAITMDGAELARGGGGCRCMTLPVKRELVAW